jgi:hypothetical protein
MPAGDCKTILQMKKKQQVNENKQLNGRWYFSIVATLIVLFFLARQGYREQQPENGTTTMGMTPGAIRMFSESPTVIPLGRGEVPVGVLRLGGETFVIYATKGEE